MLPKLACLCCTYGRPTLLPESIQSFLSQDYPADRCELIVLDDAGQYVEQSHADTKPWHLISTSRRFVTLGEKRNATAALASADVDAYVVWDDDDIYLPWTLQAHAAALEKAAWSRPTFVLVEGKAKDRLQVQETKGLFHASCAFTREAFLKAKGYPFMQSGQDQGLAGRFKGNQVATADPLELGFAPFYFYRWGTVKSYHLSAMDAKQGYARLADKCHRGPRIEIIEPRWARDYTQPASPNPK